MDGEVTRHGGYRPGSGPKPKGYIKSEGEEGFDAARSRNEAAKASLNELKFLVESGKYLPRSAQQVAAATALAVLTQSLRSIPDNVERTLSLPPEVVEEISRQVDAALSECAQAFKLMVGDPPTEEPKDA